MEYKRKGWIEDLVVKFLEDWNLDLNTEYETLKGFKVMFKENLLESIINPPQNYPEVIPDNNYEKLVRLLNLDYGMIRFDVRDFRKGDTVFYMDDTEIPNEIQGTTYDPTNHYLLILQESKLLYPSRKHCELLYKERIQELIQNYSIVDIDDYEM